MILGFNKRFPQPIHDKIKIHTIREDKHNRWKAGRIIHMATGVRTKHYYCFNQEICTGTQIIEIANTPEYLKKTNYSPTIPLPDCGYFTITKVVLEDNGNVMATLYPWPTDIFRLWTGRI